MKRYIFIPMIIFMLAGCASPQTRENINDLMTQAEETIAWKKEMTKRSLAMWVDAHAFIQGLLQERYAKVMGDVLTQVTALDTFAANIDTINDEGLMYVCGTYVYLGKESFQKALAELDVSGILKFLTGVF